MGMSFRRPSRSFGSRPGVNISRNTVPARSKASGVGAITRSSGKTARSWSTLSPTRERVRSQSKLQQHDRGEKTDGALDVPLHPMLVGTRAPVVDEHIRVEEHLPI